MVGPHMQYCSRCGLVPYCSQNCQREDWDRRHSAACDNLSTPLPAPVTRSISISSDKTDSGYIQPLRLPRAPASELLGPPAQRSQQSRGAALGCYQRGHERSSDLPRGQGDKENNNYRQREETSSRPPLRHKLVAHRQYKAETTPDTPGRRATDNYRKETPFAVNKTHDTDDKAQPIKGTFDDAKKVNPPSVNKVNPMMVNKVTPETTHKVPATPDSTTIDLVPNKYLVETLDSGDIVTVVVVRPAKECAADVPGFVCVSLNKKRQALYDMLCNEYLVDCFADTQDYKVTPGEAFSVLVPEEEAWYRARCLTPTTAAILDSGNMLALTPATKCKKLQKKYAAVPEFCCVLQADNVKNGDQLFWRLVTKNSNGTNSGELIDLMTKKVVGSGVIRRWLPKVEMAVAPKAGDGTNATLAPSTPAPSTLAPSAPAPSTLAPSAPVRSTPAPSTPARSIPASSTPARLTPAPSVPAAATKPLIPDKCVVEMVEVGDSVMLSVERPAAQCATDAPGFICLSLHLKYQPLYNTICDQYVADCVADPDEIKVTPGDTFSVLHPEEGSWYRARCLTSTTAAILDSANVLALTPDTKCKKLQEKYAAIPEFCCLLQADNVKIGDQIECEFLSKDTATGAVTARLVNSDTGAEQGVGTLKRWLPKVQSPLPATVYVSCCIRPALVSGAPVLLLGTEAATGLVYVRPDTAEARRAYDAVVQDVLTYALQAVPLPEAPEKTDLVLAKDTDGLYYRAIVARTNVKLNKYLVEYIDSGKMDKACFEDLLFCPGRFSPQLRPAVTSAARLPPATSTAATDYLARLLQQKTKLVLTLPSGAAEAPNGSEAVLTVAVSRECVNKVVEDLSTPGWKKMEMNGEDLVLNGEVLMLNQLVYTELRPEGGKLTVLSADTLVMGVMGACMADQGPLLDLILGDLPDRIGAYCESEIGKEPYLPRCEELCIAKYEATNQWFRAIFCSQNTEGEHGTANVMFIDFGNLATLSIKDIRKMVPEFVKGVPALSCYVEIKDFPTDITEAAQIRALKFMGMEDGEFGQLNVTRCVLKEGEPGCYIVEAPELLAAIGSV